MYISRDLSLGYVYLAISCQQRILCSTETSSDSAILISFSIGLISNFNSNSSAVSYMSMKLLNFTSRSVSLVDLSIKKGGWGLICTKILSDMNVTIN